MFFRIKKSGGRGYVQVVENKRVDGAVRQSVIANLGRADDLTASGALAALLASGAKLTDQVLLINALDEDADGSLSVAAKRIGGPLLFGRMWERLGIADVLGELLKHRAFEFAVERAVFVGTLHRLFVSGSDRDCSSWLEDYDIPGVDGLDLHHFYRAMAWLGEEMEEKPEGALAPRCVKDVIEEKLFDRRRDASARPRSPAACTHPPSRQRLAGAHRRLQADRRSVLSRPYRAAATRQADGAAGNRAAHKICPQTPRPPQAWCHVVANFAESGVISICSEF